MQQKKTYVAIIGVDMELIPIPGRKQKLTCLYNCRIFNLVQHGQWYCWWKKSCTTQYVRNPVNNGLFTISTGERRISEPSTVNSQYLDLSTNSIGDIGAVKVESSNSFCWREYDLVVQYLQNPRASTLQNIDGSNHPGLTCLTTEKDVFEAKKWEMLYLK